ncbi:MAG: rsmA [Paenibacillaceae bacterium]|jgi:16S rRNA (adenine1518-N6/adenine1519-N6)-dimethyltransferase|nr:rsmA [Paenibacillaceae bacterium]
MNKSNGWQDVATPGRTKEVLARFDLKAKKSLGQNFLIDLNVLDKIVAAAQLDRTKGALEIGPGIGALTQQLAKRAGKVTAVEIDQRMLPVLAETLQGYDNAAVVHADVLKLDLAELFGRHFQGLSGVSVVANLPYYVTTPIVMKLLEERLPLENIVVMVQKEVADRMAAKPGSKDYGSLSVAVQYYCEPKVVAVVPHTVFIPKPNVDSAVICLKVRGQSPVKVDDEQLYFEVVRASFAQRRKTISNNLLTRFFSKETRPLLDKALLEAGIDPVRRGETLNLEEFASLTQSLIRAGIRS